VGAEGLGELPQDRVAVVKIGADHRVGVVTGRRSRYPAWRVRY
jgi:hypothetical protein